MDADRHSARNMRARSIGSSTGHFVKSACGHHALQVTGKKKVKKKVRKGSVRPEGSGRKKRPSGSRGGGDGGRTSGSSGRKKRPSGGGGGSRSAASLE